MLRSVGIESTFYGLLVQCSSTQPQAYMILPDSCEIIQVQSSSELSGRALDGQAGDCEIKFQWK